MKFLIVGLGSIGQRHYKNLLAEGHEDIIVYRTGKGSQAFVGEFEREHQPVIYDNIERAFNEKPDAVFITNPTALHDEVFRKALSAGVRGIFMEKPIAHDASRVRELVHEADEQGVIGCVGYNLRFHPLLQKMKEMVEGGTIGRVIGAAVDSGEYLPDWHPWEDYRTSYAAKSELGGGVVLTQSHDIDYIYWFFGMPKKVFAFGGAKTGLKVSAEDIVKGVMEHPGGVTVSLEMDFYRRPPRRIFEITGTAGSLLWDYYGGRLELRPQSKEDSQMVFSVPEKFERNDMFREELRQFLLCLAGQAEPRVTLRDGLNVLAISSALLDSIKSGQAVSL